MSLFISRQVTPQIAVEFVDEVLIPKAQTPLQQFALGVVKPYLKDAVLIRFDGYMPLMQMLTIADANGKVDLEKARAACADQMSKMGTVKIGEYLADGKDIDALYEIAKRHATTE